MSEATNNQTTVKTTVNEGQVTHVQGGQFRLETPWIIGGLIVALIVLKSFIYIKDNKRHGK